VLYSEGRGVPNDQKQALIYFRKAAEAGTAEAQFNLGLCYAHGQGVPTNWVEAVRWYRKAAEAGVPEAQANLGLCVARGQGTTANNIEAVTWLTKAANAGLAEAACSLGAMYQNGKGVSQNLPEAFKWFKTAAEKGNAVAQRILGVMYAKGSGCRQDNLEAYTWLFIAAARREQEPDLMQELRRNMPPDQIREAEIKASATLVRKSEPRPSPTPEVRIGPTASPVPRPSPARVAAGSGFFVTDDGYFLTCHHVMVAASRIQLKYGVREIPARLIWSNADHDVALLKADGWFAALPMVASSSVRLGESIFTIGFPNTDVQGLSPKFSRGEISALAGMQDDPRFFQVSLPIQPGNSGGPLVDIRGNVIGLIKGRLNDAKQLTTTGFVAQNVNYGVKSSVVLEGMPALARRMRPAASPKLRELSEIAHDVELAVAMVVAYP
jgi:S1-C subfamily serine protease